jgi:hypothetical protein
MNEEVKEEVEALMSIYEGDIEVLQEFPTYDISMNVRSMTENDAGECPSILLRISYPKGYPQEILNIDFDEEEREDFDESDLKDLLVALDEVMEENKGDVMTFLVISAAIEWLEQYHQRKNDVKMQIILDKKEAADAILTAKLIGTKVTVESFTAWKMEFDAKKMQKKSKKAQTGEKKLSGRDLFLQNSTLNESDLTFIVDDENVDFDEALFDDLDTLDLEDD